MRTSYLQSRDSSPARMPRRDHPLGRTRFARRLNLPRREVRGSGLISLPGQARPPAQAQCDEETTGRYRTEVLRLRRWVQVHVLVRVPSRATWTGPKRTEVFGALNVSVMNQMQSCCVELATLSSQVSSEAAG